MPLQEYREEFSGAKQLFVSYCHEAKKHAYTSSKEVMALCFKAKNYKKEKIPPNRSKNLYY